MGQFSSVAGVEASAGPLRLPIRLKARCRSLLKVPRTSERYPCELDGWYLLCYNFEVYSQSEYSRGEVSLQTSDRAKKDPWKATCEHDKETSEVFGEVLIKGLS